MKLFNSLNQYSDDQGSEHNALRQEGIVILLQLLHPITPHITQYLWNSLGFDKRAILHETWKIADESAKVTETIELIVQINGKLRGKITLPVTADQHQAQTIALADEKIKQSLGNKICKKIIFVPGKLINIVAIDPS